jgi:hypothetical protein
MDLEIEKGHIAGLQIFLLNLSLAVTLGLFAGLALRSLVLLALDRNRPALVMALRALGAAAFLGFAVLDFIFSQNMLVWDRLSRAVVTACAIAFPMIAFARQKKGSAKPPETRHALYVAGTLVALCVFSVLTLLRSGTVALTGDRVTLTVEVTGETRVENEPVPNPPGTTKVTLYHAVIWLPTGAPLADVWLPGDRIRVKGRIYRLSPALNSLGLPNLYEFVSVRNDTENTNKHSKVVMEEFLFAEKGPLGVHPWWKPIQASILSHWEAATGEDSFFALRAVPNASPDYPLEDGQGRPIRKTFLLVLPPSGQATSRGSSPLEKNTPVSH